jgi:hypothetical protein
MAYSFEEFCADTRSAIQSKKGAEAHEAVRQNLEKLLSNEDFVTENCGPGAEPGIRTIYRDDDTDFNVLIHVYPEGKKGPPHDHGTSWAVYGQAAEYTDMTGWRRLDKNTGVENAKIEKVSTVRLEPGMAGKFEVGEIHSIEFPAGARFVRITGTDLDAIPTLRFDPQAGMAAVGSRL